MTSKDSGNFHSGKKLRLGREKIGKTQEEMIKEDNFPKVELRTYQGWEQKGIPKKQIQEVAQYFGVKAWVFQRDELKKKEFQDILDDPNLQEETHKKLIGENQSHFEKKSQDEIFEDFSSEKNFSELQGKGFKVLSLDGGGIKGLYTASILAKFEDTFQKPIVDCFDLICGTSTGGLIALALSLKVPAQDIVQFYEEEGPKIFPQERAGKFRQRFWKGKYQDHELKKALDRTFGDRNLNDSHCLLCIPSFSITQGKPVIFKVDHPQGKLSRDAEISYLDVALATTASPTYFPIVEIEQEQFIDGGLFANNPAMIGFTEAISYFVGQDHEFDHLQLMSIASLEVSNAQPPQQKRNRSFVDWGKDLFAPFMTAPFSIIHFQLQKIAESKAFPLHYLRIPSAEVSAEQNPLVQLDNSSPKALQLFKIKGKDQGLIYEKKKEVQHFFTFPKCYQRQKES